MDSDHRSRKATDLQSAPFDRSGTPPDTSICDYVESNWSWQTDLNPRPADYKSAALPTELRQRFSQRLTIITFYKSDVKAFWKKQPQYEKFQPKPVRIPHRGGLFVSIITPKI